MEKAFEEAIKRRISDFRHASLLRIKYAWQRLRSKVYYATPTLGCTEASNDWREITQCIWCHFPYILGLTDFH